jgi:8-oxo-dGTP diphosphatase
MSASEPARPIPAAIAVVVRDRRVLLVRRANPPDQGRWGFPGGRIEPGEPVTLAAQREVGEETGVTVEPVQPFTTVDVIERDAGGGLRHHFVLVAVFCRWIAGEGMPADDALETAWFTLDAIRSLGPAASDAVDAVAAQALAIAAHKE